METLFFDKPSEVRKNRLLLEEKLKVKITLQGKKVSFEGDPIAEYEAQTVLQAIQLGFSASKALLLLNDDIIFRQINIKDFTRRKKLRDVRARVIGAEGKTKRTIEEISDCYVAISGNHVGIIGSAESIDEAITAITNLVRGSKEGNVYGFLERMNAEKKKYR